MTIMLKSISTYLMITILSVVTLILFLFFSGYYYLERNQQMTTLSNGLDIASGLLVSGLAVPLWNFDETQIDTFMDGFMKNREVAFLELKSRENTYRRGRDNAWNIIRNIAPDTAAIVIEQDKPVIFNGQKIGSVRIGLTLKYLNQELLRKAVLMLGIVLLLDGIIFASLYLILSRKLLQPLKMLDRFAVSVIGGGEDRGLIDGRPFMGELKTLRGSLITMMDVMATRFNQQTRLQDQLHQAQRMEVIGQLAGGIAHDFNNMLAGIMVSAELLKRRLKGDEGNLKLITTILEASRRSADLTRELLAFSRKGLSAFLPLSIHGSITSVIAILERTLSKNISIETRLLAENHVVKGDEALLQNALLNLAINARDAMPDGGVLSLSTANVFLDSAAVINQPFEVSPGHFLELSLSDTGIGMTSEIIEHIFEPFFTTKDQGKGTGLGLAAVYGTVSQHHGTINVYSEPGLGTVFKVYLPVSDETPVVASEGEAVSRNGGILYVDDEAILLSTGQSLLEDLGYSVLLAENGMQAIEIYAREREHIQLILLDMIMPGLNGKETFLQLLEIDPDVRVLFCSGVHQEGTAEELIQLGAKGFIQKPYSRVALSRAVAKAIATE